eukprot:758124-Hanusia_phi.AAC.1
MGGVRSFRRDLVAVQWNGGSYPTPCICFTAFRRWGPFVENGVCARGGGLLRDTGGWSRQLVDFILDHPLYLFPVKG